MAIKFKQGSTELANNVKELFASYEVKGRKLADTPANGQLMMAWLGNNCTDPMTGLTDGSYDNMRRAIFALHTSKAGLQWDREPAKVVQKPQQEDYRHSLEVAARDAKNIIDAQQVEADNAALAEAVGIIRRHNNFPHSRAERERNALAGEYDKQKLQVGLGKQTAAGLLAAVKKMKESF